MPQTNDTSATSAGTNGHSRIGETLYALTDEQILDIDDAEVTPPSRADAQQRDSSTRPPLADFPRSDNSQGAGSVGQTFRSVPGDVEHAPDNAPSAAANRTDVDVRPTASGAEASEKGPQETAALEAAPPEWLAQAMNDPQRGGEARQFWESAQQARAQAAQLASLDHAYFGARDSAPAERSASRDALAQQLLREDPAAFREMLAAGLRVLDSSGPSAPQNDHQTSARSESPVTSHQSPVTTHQSPSTSHQSQPTDHEARLAHYAAFERAANDDLERAVRPEISRILERALPAGNNESTRTTRERLSGMVHSEIETALRQDRALGEQVAELLRARSFDGETRAQVVRLIAARAASLVPEASRRVLAEWTQSALAAHRARRSQDDASGSPSQSREASAASNSRADWAARDSHGRVQSADSSARAARAPKNNATRNPGQRINYRALSDEEIVNL